MRFWWGFGGVPGYYGVSGEIPGVPEGSGGVSGCSGGVPGGFQVLQTPH